MRNTLAYFREVSPVRAQRIYGIDPKLLHSKSNVFAYKVFKTRKQQAVRTFLWRYGILSTCQFVDLPICLHANLSTCQFVNLSFCQLDILLT